MFYSYSIYLYIFKKILFFYLHKYTYTTLLPFAQLVDALSHSVSYHCCLARNSRKPHYWAWRSFAWRSASVVEAALDAFG